MRPLLPSLLLAETSLPSLKAARGYASLSQVRGPLPDQPPGPESPHSRTLSSVPLAFRVPVTLVTPVAGASVSWVIGFRRAQLSLGSVHSLRAPPHPPRSGPGIHLARSCCGCEALSLAKGGRQTSPTGPDLGSPALRATPLAPVWGWLIPPVMPGQPELALTPPAPASLGFLPGRVSRNLHTPLLSPLAFLLHPRA